MFFVYFVLYFVRVGWTSNYNLGRAFDVDEVSLLSIDMCSLLSNGLYIVCDRRTQYLTFYKNKSSIFCSRLFLFLYTICEFKNLPDGIALQEDMQFKKKINIRKFSNILKKYFSSNILKRTSLPETQNIEDLQTNYIWELINSWFFVTYSWSVVT
jgi:hypothetical protein